MLTRTLVQQGRSTLLDPNQHLCWQGLWSNKVVQHCWIQTNTCAGKDSDPTKSFNIAGSKPILVLANTLIQQGRSTLLDPNQHLCWQGLWSNKVVQRKNNISRNVTKCFVSGEPKFGNLPYIDVFLFLLNSWQCLSQKTRFEAQSLVQLYPQKLGFFSFATKNKNNQKVH